METHNLKSNGWFSIIEPPKKYKDGKCADDGTLYISVLNEATGEHCFKKIYENKKGLHFKYSSTYRKTSSLKCADIPSVHYIDSFTQDIIYVPYQIIR